VSSEPLVNVVMPVYNYEKYLRKAVDSILTQTFRDFELIVVNDGSTDGSVSILEEYRQKDRRVVIYNHSKNQGIVAALNRGIRMGRSKYIARMDADDISKTNRLEIQLQFLESHPYIGLVGSAARLINSKGRISGRQPVVIGPLALKWNLLSQNPFIHSSIFVRREVLEKVLPYYSSEFPYTEDYDLWTRLESITQFENINIPLIDHRVHGLSITFTRRKRQFEEKNKISTRIIRSMLPNANITDAEIVNMCNALIGLDETQSMPIDRSSAALVYLDLWNCFTTLFKNDSEIPVIMESVLSKAAKLALFPPFQNNLLQNIHKMREVNPNWLWFFVKSLPSSFLFHIQNRLIGP